METSTFTDADSQAVLKRSVRTLAILAAAGALLAWWKAGWQSGLLLLVGAAIAGSGVWEWTRLMSTVMARMDDAAGGGKARPMGLVLTGFFLRLGLAIVVLYGSLKFLHGSVLALAVGLGLGVVSLTFEAIKLARTWTT